MPRRPRKLGELLTGDRVITTAEVARALESQAIYGGRIGTNLVDLGLVDIEQIGQYLSVQLGVPVALGDDLLGAPASVLPILSAEQCAHYRIFPLRLEQDLLHLALLDPLDEVTIKEVELLTRTRVRPHVAPELLLVQALEKRYRIPREKRFLAAPDRRGEPTGGRRKAVSLLMAYNPKEDLAAPARRAGVDDLELDLQSESDAGVPDLPPSEPDDEYIDGDTTEQWSRPPVQLLDARGTAAALSRARDRQTLINHLVQAVDPRAASAVLFVVRGPMAVAHAASGTRATREQLEKLVLPLDTERSLLQQAHTARHVVRGGAKADPSQQVIANQLGWPDPGEVCVAPVIHEGQVVVLLCVQTTAGNQLADGIEADLGRLSALATEAYLRIVARHTTKPELPVVRPPVQQDSAPPPEQPTLYDTRFFITGEAGTRSFARLWRAVDTSTQKVAAIYSLPADLGETQRVTREALALQKLSHPTLPRVHGTGITAEGQTYVVTEWIEGIELRARLDADPVPPRADVSRIVQATANGLELAHRSGLLHRDLTPQHVLLIGPERRRVKLVNFGITRVVSEDGRYLPTPEYRAPEITARGEGASPASDVFSLAVIAYEMLAGRRPAGPLEPGRPPIDLAAIPSLAQKLIVRALSPAPQLRPSAAELGRGLAQALRGPPLQPPKHG